MLSNADHRQHIAPSARIASAAITSLQVDAFKRDTKGVMAPHAEAQLVVRFGPSPRHGFDVHAMGARERVHRKWIQAGHEALVVRLRLGAHEAVLGLPVRAPAGRIVGIEELWGSIAARELHESLAVVLTSGTAAAVMERPIAQRLAAHPPLCARTHRARCRRQARVRQRGQRGARARHERTQLAARVPRCRRHEPQDFAQGVTPRTLLRELSARG